jgi:hypothetical protein
VSSIPGPDPERMRRIADNEALFRSVNERVEEINEAFATLTRRFEIVCECGDIRCTEQISVEFTAYEAVRSDSALFIIVPGHEIPDVEDAVEHHPTYTVVRKHPGIPQAVAEAQDPRSD